MSKACILAIDLNNINKKYSSEDIYIIISTVCTFDLNKYFSIDILFQTIFSSETIFVRDSPNWKA